MSEMEKFEKELNELELDRIEDEEFKRKLYIKLMEKYESKRRFILSPFFKGVNFSCPFPQIYGSCSNCSFCLSSLVDVSSLAGKRF